MKTFSYCLACILVSFSIVSTSNAHWSEGRIFCDANQNGQIDAGDVPLPGILVVVTNVSGTFSNAAFSGNDGLFIVQVPETNLDSYVEFLNPATVPPNSGTLIPSNAVYHFSINSNIFVGDWLINNPACQQGGCWLTGGGTIGSAKKPAHSFGGNVFPGCSPTPGQGGQWNNIAHNLRLHFQGTVVNIVDCGNVQGIPPGSKSPVTPFNFIEFQGTGRLQGIQGSKASYDNVHFFARAEDRAEPGSKAASGQAKIDRYYLRVYNDSGTTLLLISGDTANPTNVVTVPISTGNLQMHKCQ